jgi:hypothetical protein
MTYGEERFAALDANHTGTLSIVPVRGFVKTMCPGANDAQVGAGLACDPHL